jgi:hypothetical protein
MAWDTRKNNRKYYYRSKRCGNTVSRAYFGGGLMGEMAAEIDAEKQSKRRARAALFRAEKARLERSKRASWNSKKSVI